MGKRGGGRAGGGSSGETDGAAPVKQRFNKGKFKSFSRGRNYVTSEEDMDHRERFQEWKRKKKGAGSDDDDMAEGSEEDSSEEEESGEEGEEGEGGEKGEGEGKEGEEGEAEKLSVQFAKKVQVRRDLPPSGSEGEEEGGKGKKPAAGAGAAGGGGGGGGGGEGLTRKEREEAAKARAKEEYLRKYREGETEQAKKDLARLAEVRARREEAAKKREEEIKLAAEAEERAKAGAAAAGGGGADAIEKLDPREIKKMSGSKLKECLKKRGLSTQGQKKDLVDRLVAHETGGKK